MKKFIIILLVILLVISCLTGCDKLKKMSEPTEEPVPTNGIVVTPEPEIETVEAEEAIIEIKNE